METVTSMSSMVNIIDINTASNAQLCTIQNIGPSRSAAILQLRDAHLFLTPQILADNNVMTLEFWLELERNKLVSFELIPASNIDVPNVFSAIHSAAQSENSDIDGITETQKLLESYSAKQQKAAEQMSEQMSEQFYEQQKATDKMFGQINKQQDDMSRQIHQQQDDMSRQFHKKHDEMSRQFHKQHDELSQLVQQFVKSTKVQTDTNATHFRSIESTQTSLKNEIQDLSESMDSFTRQTEQKYSGLSESVARNAENINELDHTMNISLKQIESVIPSNGIFDQSKKERKNDSEIKIERESRPSTKVTRNKHTEEGMGDPFVDREERREGRDTSRSPHRPKLGRFSGESGEQIESFLFQFDRTANRRQWSADHSACRLLDLVGGRALEFSKAFA